MSLNQRAGAWGYSLSERRPQSSERSSRIVSKRISKVRPESFATVKTAIGGAWVVVIDEMYNDYAARITPDNLMKMMAECAELLLGTLKGLAERDVA